MKVFVLTLFFLLAVTTSTVSSAQNIDGAIKDYNKKTRVQHLRIGEDIKTISEPKAVQEEVVAEPVGSGQGGEYIRSLDSIAEDLDDQFKKNEVSDVASLKLNDHFPPLGDITKWPWIKELTFSPENPKAKSAMAILEKDLSKVPPSAMIWGAYHAYEIGEQEKALFLYLASRLRSSVDQARFDKDDGESQYELAADGETGFVNTSSVSKDSGGGSEYKAIAASIGKPILRYGLKNRAIYSQKLEEVMAWDILTPYDYMPSAGDLIINDAHREDWLKRYAAIRRVYQKQMAKLVVRTSKKR